MGDVVSLCKERSYPLNPDIKRRAIRLIQPSDDVIWATCPSVNHQRCKHCTKTIIQGETSEESGEEARSCYWTAESAARMVLAAQEIEDEKIK